MISFLLEPFNYNYMVNALVVSCLVGSVCAFLSNYLMLKGWSLIGDALSHSIIPGVAISYIINLPFAFGAFLSGAVASALMMFIKKYSNLKEDAIIGLVFTTFFGFGLFIISIYPVSLSVEKIMLGDILTVSSEDKKQLLIITVISLFFLLIKWKELLLVFFDEKYAIAIGINSFLLKFMFFMILSAACISALKTVGAFLVICMLVTPGASAYLLSDDFKKMIFISIFFGFLSCFLGTYLSFHLNGATGAIIILIQTVIFIFCFLCSPKYGFIRKKLMIRTKEHK